MPVSIPTSPQLNSALRHVYTSAGTAFTIFAVLGVLPKDQVQPAIDAIHGVGDGLEQVFGNVSKLVVIFGPIAIGFSVKAATFAASLKGQLRSITTNSEVKIEGQIVTSPDVASAVPSRQVVSK